MGSRPATPGLRIQPGDAVRGNGKHSVRVVRGGKANAKREARMRDLITKTIPGAATQKTTPVVAEKPDRAAAASVPVGAPSLQNAHQ